MSKYNPLPEDFGENLEEIRDLLKEAYEHYFTYEGHCKSSEAAISVEFPPFFWREGEGLGNGPAIGVYSYVLGPHRQHYFDDIDKALATVREWHAKEMAYDPEGEGDWPLEEGSDLKWARL